MTEGIIQKIFKQYNYNNKAIIDRIEQELIEEIKINQHLLYTIGTDLPITGLTIEELIGDNQE
jgi:hypothetical protein